MRPCFVDSTPVLGIVVRNPFMDKVFPSEGEVLAILDTGFEGFLLVPNEVFNDLSLNQFETQERGLILPDGTVIRSLGTFSEVLIPSLGVRLEGFVETARGVEEVVAGTGLMENLRLVIDYCSRRIEVESCLTSSPP